MISIKDVEAMIKTELPDALIQIEDLKGGDHLQATVVSSKFEGITLVKQHQMVYKAVQGPLSTEEIHALALKTYTPAQWEASGQVA